MDRFLSNLTCICENHRASAFWGSNGGCAKIGVKIVNQKRQNNIFKLNSLVKVKNVYTHKKHCLMCILGLFGVCAKYDANDAIQNRQNNLLGEFPQFCSNFTCFLNFAPYEIYMGLILFLRFKCEFLIRASLIEHK